MEINKDSLHSFLLFNDPIKYTEKIILYPVKVKDIVKFHTYLQSIIVRKNSIFPEKQIIRMSYLDFLHYCHLNKDLSEKYKIDNLPLLFYYAKELLMLVCQTDDVLVNNETGQFCINGHIVDSEAFDDLRRIIIIQNDVDFDVDEFLNYDAEQALLKAKNLLDKDKSTLEDQIDSYAIATKSSDSEIKELTIRKFGRYITRLNMYDDYKICMTASMSGMVTFKNPIRHWTVSINKEDKFKDMKTSENEFNTIKNDIG